MRAIRWLRVARPADVRRALESLRAGEWLALAVSGGHDPLADTAERSFSEFLAAPAEMHVVIDPGLATLGPEVLAGALGEALDHPERLTLLVTPGDLPPTSGKNHGPVYSFAAPARLLQGSTVCVAVPTPERLSFLAVRRVMGGLGVGIVASECRGDRKSESRASHRTDGDAPGSIALIMAHRGPIGLLETALGALASCEGPPDVVRVGLDVDDRDFEAYREMAAAFPGVEFYVGSDAPVGPYVIRQALASLARERYVVFHDSDDLSTSDRFLRLRAEAERGPGLIGSHELRYDEEDGEIRAVRFPLDVTAALAVEPRHPQLHPTTMLAADDFRRAGGFSTDCVFGNDTQFMLRAYFAMPLRNVDRFLYIRRDRLDSLTNAPETGMDNPVRIARNDAWRSDFEAIKAGRMRLEESSLMAVDGQGGWTPRRFQPSRSTGRRR